MITTEPVTDTQLANARQIAPFASFTDKATALVMTANEVAKIDPNDPKSSKLARTTRLDLKKLRCDIENRRKELVEDLNKETGAINTAARKFKELIEPLEAKLLETEEHAERMEAKRIADLKEAREAELAPFVLMDVANFNLVAMTEAEYSAFLADCQQQTKDRAAKAEQDKRDEEAKEAADKAERERVAAENERLRAEAAENDRKLAEERKRAAAELAAQAEVARLAKERQDLAVAEAARLAKQEVDRLAKEAQDARELHAAKLDEEKKAREAVEQKMRDIEAEAKRAAQARKDEAERVEAERIAAEEAAAKAPDRDRLLAFADTIASMTVPPMSTTAGRAVVDEIGSQIAKFAAYVTRKAETL